MINKINVKNFKSLKKIDMPLKKLNVLAGLNGMGKSSLIHVLLLLRQSRLIDTWKLDLNGDLINIGKGSDALYQFAEDEVISFSLEWNERIVADYAFESHAEDDSLNRIKTDAAEEHSDDYLKSLQYISANRLGPSIIYDMSQSFVKNAILGSYGQYTSHFLSVNGNRLKIDHRRLHPSTSSPFLSNQVTPGLEKSLPG